MIICHIWDADYPWDVRVEKVTHALSGAGHEVHIVARNKRGDPAVEQLPDATVHRLRPIGFSRRLNTVSSFPAFVNPRWVARIQEVVKQTGAEMLLVRDLPLAPAAVWVGRRLGIPVAMDMAENYPAMIRAVWEAGRQRRWDFLVRNPRIAAAVERWVLPRLDHTFVVIEESKERLIRMGVPSERITVVLNTPPRDRLAQAPRQQEERREYRLFYLGLLETPRGIGELIEGVAIARAAGVDVSLEVVGRGRDENVFRQLAADLGLGSAVRFHGYLPYAEGLEIMRTADVGVVPHYANESWNTTIPNKLFDYMAAGLPVLSSDVTPVARILGETKAGIVYRSRDAGDAAAAMRRLQDPELRRSCGEAGRRAVAERYHWEWDAERLTAAVQNLVAHG